MNILGVLNIVKTRYKKCIKANVNLGSGQAGIKHLY